MRVTGRLAEEAGPRPRNTGPVPESEAENITPPGAVLPAGTPGASGTPVRRGIKNPFSGLLRRKTEREIIEYDVNRHGPLTGASVPDWYEILEQYWVEKGRALVTIALNRQTNQNEYLLSEPVLSAFEYELLERIHEDLRDVLILSTDELQTDKQKLLLEKMYDLLDEYGVGIKEEALFKLQYYLTRNFIGWSRIDALMKDPHLEDISCDGVDIPIFLYHRKYRNIRTNISFRADALNSLAITLAQRSGKHISTGNPMLDATLPDGSRLQLTLGTEVTTRGTSFTIRKFREEPYSPIELLEIGTLSADSLAYFWLSIENNKSLLFIGGTASGKTTSLNAVSMFIPPVAKVVSIEDTREITLHHENWIASVTRPALSEGGTVIDMFDLLRAAMRQRPEFIIVGEVRGHEAQTLFQAMNTGHTTFSTMHAGSVDAAIHRLESEPLNVSRNMVQALDIITVQALIYHGTERFRRVQEIVEVAGIDPTTGNLRVNNVFVYDPVKDRLSFTGRSRVLSDIAGRRGWSGDQVESELRIRRQVLEAMKEQGMYDYISVAKIIHVFHIDRQKVAENLADLRRVIR